MNFLIFWPDVAIFHPFQEFHCFSQLLPFVLLYPLMHCPCQLLALPLHQIMILVGIQHSLVKQGNLGLHISQIFTIQCPECIHNSSFCGCNFCWHPLIPSSIGSDIDIWMNWYLMHSDLTISNLYFYKWYLIPCNF